MILILISRKNQKEKKNTYTFSNAAFNWSYVKVKGVSLDFSRFNSWFTQELETLGGGTVVRKSRSTSVW